MPSAIRQSGPRPALRHLAPTGNAPASRGLPTTTQRVGEQTRLLSMAGEEGVRMISSALAWSVWGSFS